MILELLGISDNDESVNAKSAINKILLTIIRKE